MKIRGFLVGLLLSASAAPAFAAGPYVGAAGGVSFVHDSDIEVTGAGTAAAEYDTGFGFSVSAGYDFQPFRVEFEFGYKNAGMDKISRPGRSVSVSDSDATAMSYMVNGFYDIRTNTPLVPYFGAGLGAIHGKLEIEGNKGDVVEFGYQLIAGAAYIVNRNIALDLSYRFQHAPSDFSEHGVSIEYMSSSVMAGLRYSF